ncbi:putative alcohol dehydrogenase, zinc-independent [Meredithblackwellia eburnea MCA 4105]
MADEERPGKKAKVHNGVEKPGRLAGKVAIVTGGSTGLGRGIALSYAKEGAKVAVFDLTNEQLEGHFDTGDASSTVDAINKSGGEALFFKVDSGGERQVTADAMAAVVEAWGKLDIFVACAGVYCPILPFHEQSAESLDRCYSVQVRGAFVQSQEAVKIMLKQDFGGNIVQLVSTAGLMAHPDQAPYEVSKGAQSQLTRCIATEYGPNNIRCNGICPTWIKTALTSKLFHQPAFKTKFESAIPMKRWGEVDDVAKVAVFLGSDESSFMTGELVRVDGGELLNRFSK